jgi:ABC-2 type transport system ATP-binding protein
MYQNQRGVNNIDFSMERGEVVGFLGPNGAGKTTTMRMITGYLNPSKGNILVDGLSMSDHPRKARRKIGYLPESPPLYPEMTVYSYLDFIADLRDVAVKEKKKRIEEVISKLGMNGRERQIIRSLSKGYRQRVGLAQAILHKPDLLIMDEPTSGLDPKQIIEIRQLIKELGENHTVLLSTHILPEVNTLCNRVLIINAGRIVLDSKSSELSNAISNNFEVNLEVRGKKDDVIRKLRSLESVKTVKEIANRDEERAEGEPSVRLHIVSRSKEDIREQIFYKMAEAKLPILEMRRENPSLEDVFLKLTASEPAVLNDDVAEDENDNAREEEEVDKDA